MEIVKVTTKEELDYLYKNSALTVEGLSEDSINEYVDDLKTKTTFSRERVFVISGELMNSVYKLTGDNRYPDDLTIISISLEDIEPGPIIIARFGFGGRWFDDIVDNNARREYEKTSK